MPVRSRPVVALLLASALSPTIAAQSTDPAVFVGNNGNLEGSVSSLRITADGSLQLVDRVITGTGDEPGTNAATIAVTPDGRYLATGHTTANDDFEQLTILEVHPDLTLSLVGAFTTPNSPLDLQWITDEHIAVTMTSIGGDNTVVVHEFTADPPGIVTIDTEPTGDFSTALAVDRVNGRLFAQDSFGDQVHSFRINSDGTLDHLDSLGTGGIYPLGIGISPDGSRLYGGGGISGGGDKVLGFGVDIATGAFSTMPGAPYVSAGDSPKQVVVSGDGSWAIVAHGGDATMRIFAIDEKTGALAPTATVFDVGFQGTLGECAAMDDLVFVTDDSTIDDGVRGVYSFTLGPDGTLTQNGPLVSTQGIGPEQMAVWKPDACPADANGDGDVDVGDLMAVLAASGACGGCAADVDGDGDVDVDDLLAVIAAYGTC